MVGAPEGDGVREREVERGIEEAGKRRERKQSKAENEGTREGNYVAARLWAANGCRGSPSKTMGWIIIDRILNSWAESENIIV
jgi:hypothetical protein